MMIMVVLVFFGLIFSFVYAPKITAASVAALIVMFLYVWIFDPQCMAYARQHPEWGGKCGLQLAEW